MDREYLKDKGWRRHSVISHRNGGVAAIHDSLPNNIQALLAKENAIAIIATYDCAVVSADFEAEPWVQILVAFPTIFSKKLASCRDPRRLHFSIILDAEEHNYEVNALGICQIDRRILCDIEPDQGFELSGISREQLNYWIAERFRQETWPDAFNTGLRSAEKRLKNFYKRYNQFVPAMYIKLNDYDELEGAKYEISVILAVENESQRTLLKVMRKKHKELANKSIDEVYDYIANDVARTFGDTVTFMPDLSRNNKKSIEVVGEGALTVLNLRTHFRFSPYSLSAEDETVPNPIDAIPGKVF